MTGGAKRRPARRPAPRTVTVTIPDGAFAGWEATCRADFPAKLLAKLESGKAADIVEVLDAIVVEHNFPNAQDELATSLAEVDPYDGLMVVAGALFDAIGKLPNR